jgi:hypothetical protein
VVAAHRASLVAHPNGDPRYALRARVHRIGRARSPQSYAALCFRGPLLLAARPRPPYPSCQIYANAEQGWWCFGCQRGGRIYDLASLMSGGAWGGELSGEAFRAARELVAAAVG